MPLEHNLDRLSVFEHASGLGAANFLEGHHFDANLSVTENTAYAGYLSDSPSTSPANTLSLASSESCSPQPIPDTPTTSEFAPRSAPNLNSGKRKRPDHIPRPCNAFFIFRSDFVRAHAQLDGGRQQNLSKRAAIAWHMISPGTKGVYEAKAVAERETHRFRYPGYAYMPSSATRKAGGRKRKIPPKAAVGASMLEVTSPASMCVDLLPTLAQSDEAIGLPIDASCLSVTDLPPALNYAQQPFSLGGQQYIDPFVGPSSLPLFPHELQFTMPPESFYLSSFNNNYMVPSLDNQIDTTSYDASFPSNFGEYYFY